MQQWTTRMHWFWGFLFPSGWCVVLYLMAVAGVLTYRVWGVLIAFLLATAASFGFSFYRARWRIFSLTIVPGERVIWERNGFVMIAERRINFGMGSILFKQTLMGRLLDYGNLSIGALGGPYEWRNLGRFRTLRRIVESNGAWMPQQHAPLHIPVQEWLRRLGNSLQEIWNDLVRQWRHWRRRPRRVISLTVTQPRLSRHGRFLRYVEMFLFPRSVLHYESTSAFPGAPDPRPTDQEIRIYRRVLQMRHILIVDSKGRFFRHHRIHTMEDVERRIPADWFERYMRQYGL